MAFDPNAQIPEADWSNPNSALFNDPEFNHGNWRFNQATGQWEVGNTNMDVSNSVTSVVAPGVLPGHIDPNAPGASLDSSQSNDDRTRLGGHLDQLTNQANTGGGAWEQALAANTHATQMNAEALGQTSGLDPLNAASNVANAQAGAQQRSVGQGNLLRAQTQQQAQGQLSDVLGGQGAMDAQQAAAEAAAKQARAQANATLEGSSRKALGDTVQAGAQAVGTVAALSDGGPVPGKPKVFGDTSVNDTVSAKLTPQEIVLPLSVTLAPDAPQRAAAFVEAIKARGATPGQKNFDGGGAIPTFSNVDTPKDTSTPVPTGIGDDKPYDAITPSQYAPSIARGSLLDTKPYNATRDANLANSQHFLDAYNGRGPSTAPQAMQNATDSTLTDALRAQASSHHPMDVTGAATEQSQGAAGNAAGIVAGESQRGGEAFAQALQRQRAQDAAIAQAKQQAAWRNTMMNAGVSLEQQNQIRNLLGGAGQAAVAAGGLFDSSSGGGSYDANSYAFDESPYDGSTHNLDSAPGDFEVGDGGYAADGGVIVSHLSRQGTRQAPKRPSGQKPKAPPTATPRPTGLEYQDLREHPDTPGGASIQDRDRIGGMLEKIEGVRRQTYDRDNPDLKDLEVNYAEGGEVGVLEQLRRALSGASASPIQFDSSGAPVSTMGPFAPTQDSAGPIARPVVPFATRTQSLDDPNRPEAPPIPRDVATRERPFVAKPTAAPAAAPIAPQAAPSKTPTKPAAPKGPDQFDLANQAGEQKAAAETQQADAQTAALMEGQKALEANAIDQKERAARASASAQQQLGAIQQAREEMKRIDTSVDPGKMWRDRSMVGKIFSIIGLVAGTVGNDNGVNRAASLLNSQIDRDIDAQKSEHELALRKGQSAVTSAENLYSISRQVAQDDIAAGLAAKGSALDLVANQVALAAARAGSPMAKAGLTALHAKVMGDKDATDKAAKARLEDMHLKWFGAQTDRIAAEKPSGANVMTANFVAPGYALAEGAHPKPEELEKWRTARAGADDVKAKAMQLREMISSGKLSGAGRFTGGERAKAEALLGSLKVAAKEAFGLGALSGPDIDLVMSQIANPVGTEGLFTGDQAMTTKLDQFIKNADATVTKKGDALGIVKEGAKSASSEAPRKIAVNPKTKERRYINSDGSLGEAVR